MMVMMMTMMVMMIVMMIVMMTIIMMMMMKMMKMMKMIKMMKMMIKMMMTVIGAVAFWLVHRSPSSSKSPNYRKPLPTTKTRSPDESQRVRCLLRQLGRTTSRSAGECRVLGARGPETPVQTVL